MGVVENIEVLAPKLGSNIGSLPSSYLGLPLRAPTSQKGSREVGHFEKKIHLQLWEEQTYSYAKPGSITLIHGTLSSLTKHFFQGSLSCPCFIFQGWLAQDLKDYNGTSFGVGLICIKKKPSG